VESEFSKYFHGAVVCTTIPLPCGVIPSYPLDRNHVCAALVKHQAENRFGWIGGRVYPGAIQKTAIEVERQPVWLPIALAHWYVLLED
jgi:hypothetical protein